MELLAKLGIDWGLLLAQVINFALLLGVLSMFLYRPLLDLIDRRRALIERSVRDAKNVDEELRKIDRARTEKLAALDRECGEVLARTKAEAERMKQEVLALAQKEADRILEKGRTNLERERAEVMRDVSVTLARVIVQATEKILQREFSASDQDRLMQGLETELFHLSK